MKKIIISILLMCLFLCLFLCSCSDNKSNYKNNVSEKSTSYETKSKDKSLKEKCEEKAIEYIKNRLKNPDSLKIHDIVSYGEGISDFQFGDGDNKTKLENYCVKIDYSAQNGLGGTNREKIEINVGYDHKTKKALAAFTDNDIDRMFN